MKERLTFLPSADSGLSKDDLLVRPDRLEYTKAHLTDAEWRLTLGVDEVPDEVSRPPSVSDEKIQLFSLYCHSCALS